MSRKTTNSFAGFPVPATHDTRAVSLADAAVSLNTAGDYQAEISRLWADAQRRFVEIGRRLNEAKERLPHGEFLPMLARDLPFSRSVANRLMAVAAAMDEGVVPPRALPTSYSVAYEVVTLPREKIQQAIEAGQIHPNMTRAEALALKRVEEEETPPSPTEAIQSELERLLAEQNRIADRIAALRAKLGEA